MPSRMALWLSYLRSTGPPHPKDGPWAWLVLLYTSICAMYLGGIAFGYGVILPILMESFNENRERTALVGSLALGAGLFMCVFTTKMCERYTCRVVNGIGLISYIAGFTLSSLCRSVYPLYFTYSIMNGFAGSCMFTANFIIVRKYFKRHFSLAMGFITAGSGVGVLCIGPLMQGLTDRFGWENTFRILAGAFVFLLLFVFVMDPNVEQCETTTVTAAVETENSAANLVKPRKIILGFLDVSVWTFPEFTISVIGIFFGSFGHYSPLIHLVKFSDELGMSPSKGSLLFTFIGIATIPSRLISGRLCDVMKPRYITQAGTILSGISTIMLTFATSYTHLVIFAIFYGLADGAFRVTVNILFMNTVDVPRKPTAFGQANMMTSIAHSVGPALAGLMADKSGSYTTAFYMAGSTAIFGGALFFVHLCFFKDHSSQRTELNLSDVNVDHPLACTGPAIEVDTNEAISGGEDYKF